MEQKKIRDFGIIIGSIKTGPLNKITDVAGVTVGHCTIKDEAHNTGVTVVVPSAGNIFKDKLIAASYVLNGFCKSLGLLQVDELGVIETPIMLTNTLNVGLVHDAVVEYMISHYDPSITSVNPIVCECNDQHFNIIKDRVIKKEDVYQALGSANVNFLEGNHGAGRGTLCYDLKGGIGSASRMIQMDDQEFTFGVLVQTNHGHIDDFILNHHPIGNQISQKISAMDHHDSGSIVTVIATDLPVSSRQLKRIIKRASVGLVHTGSYIGHRSGEVMIGFSTANKINYESPHDLTTIQIINENSIEKAFRAVAEATEEAILNSLITAQTMPGLDHKDRYSLKEFLK